MLALLPEDWLVARSADVNGGTGIGPESDTGLRNVVGGCGCSSVCVGDAAEDENCEWEGDGDCDTTEGGGWDAAVWAPAGGLALAKTPGFTRASTYAWPSTEVMRAGTPVPCR